MAKTAKLHELLAVDGNIKNQAEKTRTDLMQTFDKKKHHFSQKRVTFTPNTENAQPVTEEQLDLQTTVRRELVWIGEKLASAIDVSYQIEKGNTQAKADVVLPNGTTLLAGVPATVLLMLEKRVHDIHTLVAAIPTLDPAKGFEPDPEAGIGVYKAREDVRTRTKKVIEPLVLYPATKEHPAQVKEISLDRSVGEIRTLEWSGLLTVAEKGDMLDRVEVLARAVKQARTRANEFEVDTTQVIGETITRFVFGQ